MKRISWGICKLVASLTGFFLMLVCWWFFLKMLLLLLAISLCVMGLLVVTYLLVRISRYSVLFLNQRMLGRWFNRGE